MGDRLRPSQITAYINEVMELDVSSDTPSDDTIIKRITAMTAPNAGSVYRLNESVTGPDVLEDITKLAILVAVANVKALGTSELIAQAISEGQAILDAAAFYHNFEEAIIKRIGLNIDISENFTFRNLKRVNFISGKIDTAQNNYDAASNYVSVAGYSALQITRIKTTTKVVSGLAFYSGNDESAYEEQFISGVRNPYNTSATAPTVVTQTIPVPEGAKYLRTTWHIDDWQYEEGIPFSCIAINKGEISDDIEEIKDLVNGYVSGLPDYYHENDYIDQRVEHIIDNVAKSSIHGDTFFWFTDPHYFGPMYHGEPRCFSGLNGVKLIKYIQQRTNIRKIFCGGDLVNGTGMTAEYCTARLEDVRVHLDPIYQNLYMIIGNHEYNNPGNSREYDAYMLPVSQIYSMFIKDKETEYVSYSDYGDFCLDNATQKIRYICLGTSFKSTLVSGQYIWLKDALVSVPDGYTVVVLSHLGLSLDQDNYEQYDIANVIYINGYFKAVADMLDAAKAQDGNHDVIVNGATVTNCDFSSFGGEIACVITGHKHHDLEMQTDGGIWVIGTTCDRSVTLDSNEYFDAARQKGTINEHAIDVVTIDTENKNILMTRVGGSFSRKSALVNPDREYTYA